MSHRKPTRNLTRAKRIEWIGGTATLPNYVTGEGEPYRPEALFWLSADGAVLGSHLARPGELLARASENLRQTIAQPMWGTPHAPTRVRVASVELAEVLRVGHPGLDVVCAPTPEIDEILTSFREHMHDRADIESTYLSPGIEPDAMAAFFRAAAALYRAQPWARVPEDQNLISVTIEQLGLRGAAMSVIGQLEESFGLVVFPGLGEFEAFRDAADAIDAGKEPEIPGHFAISFEPGAELGSALREEISAHGWEVAGPDAYPSVMTIDEDMVARPPTVEELTKAEAIALALTRVLTETDESTLQAAWEGGEPVSRTVSVATHQGEIEVTLCTPFERVIPMSGDLLADLAALAEDDEIDAAAREALEEELLQRFADSPEAVGLDSSYACHYLMDFAADYLGETIATLDVHGLHEVVFELIPRKVSVEASGAQRIVVELRAFYAFLQREFGLVQADACLDVLDAGAIDRLESALSNPSNFGMAKSLFMAGREAGFDMDTPKGIEAWARSIEGKPMPPSISLPWQGATSPTSARVKKAKKDKRKAARKARKRNR